jgi:hypothetical protein
MREVEEKRVRAENRPHSGTDPGESTAGRGARGADDLCVPDYVMWDFGLPEEDEKEDRNNGIRT